MLAAWKGAAALKGPASELVLCEDRLLHELRNQYLLPLEEVGIIVDGHYH